MKASSLGSIELRTYLRARRGGTSMEEAAALVGMGLAEARLTDADEAKGHLAEIDTSEPASIGHNSGEKDVTDIIAGDELRLLIERIERLEEEKKGMSDDIRDVYLEAKSQGYDTKTMRAIVKLRKMEKNARDEAEALLDTYKGALGLA